MKNEKMIASFVVVLFLLPVGLINGGMLFEESKKGAPESQSYDFSIGLKGKFDPLKGERANIPNDLRLAESNGYYILQVKGPVLTEWQDELKNIGVINYGYIPNYAYLVQMTEETKAKAENLPFVRWIGNYDPGFKLGMDIPAGNEKVKINVVLFETSEIDIGSMFSKDISKIDKFNDRTSVVDRQGKTNDIETERILKSLITKDRALPFERLDNKIKDTVFGMDYRSSDVLPGMKDIEDTQRLRNDIAKRYAKLLFASEIEQIGGTIVESADDTHAVVEIAAGKISSLLFNPNVAAVYEWAPKHTCMDQISGSSFIYFDYVQTYDGGVDTYDGSKWSARFSKSKIIGANQDDGCNINHVDFDDPDIAGTQTRVIFTYGSVDLTQNHGTATGLISAGYPWGGVPKGYWGYINWNTADSTAADQVLAQGGYYITHSYGSTGNTGYYSTESKGIDDVLTPRPKMTFIWASGNAVAAGEKCAEEGTPKNVISAGGVNQGTSQTTITDDSWSDAADNGAAGTADGRQKPDLAAYYDKVTESKDSPPYGTDGFGGTSACAPTIGGAVGVAYEMFVDDYFGTGAGVVPYAATVKAMLIANANQWSNFASVPRTAQGWGYPNIYNMYERGQYVSDGEYTATPGSSKLINDIPSTGVDPFKVTLVWSDPSPGIAPGAGICLVNDLNLRVVDKTNGTTYYGNMGLGTAQWSVSGTGTNPWSGGTTGPNATCDDLNNVENVFISTPAGHKFDIYVTGENVATGSQQFSVVVSGMAPGVGKLRFDRSPPLYDYGDRVNVTLVDGDFCGPNPTGIDTGNVTVNSTKDPTGFTLYLPETGVDTSTFFTQLYCSKDLPEGVNTGLSYPSRNIIAVNEVDTIQVAYHDMSPVNTWRNKTIKYDNLPPKISNVRISDLTHTSFSVEFETDELAQPEIFIALKWNESKTARDDWWTYFPEDDYLSFYDLATLADIRNGEVEFLSLYLDTYATAQGIMSIGYPPNSTVYFAIGAIDEMGNEGMDTNSGNYYVARTVPQPFHILIMDDDTVNSYTLYGYGIGADSACYVLFLSGYYPTYKMTNDTGEVVFTDKFGGYNWSDNWKKDLTFQNYWNGFKWDAKTNSVPNILIYDHGWTNTHYGYNGGAPSRLRARNLVYDMYGMGDWGMGETDIEFRGRLYTATERTEIQDFIDNSNGKVAFYGSAVAEEYLDITIANNEGTAGATLPAAFLNTYMHADISNIGATINDTAGTAGTAEEFDVTMGGLTYSTAMDISDEDYCYIGFEGISGAKVAKTTENYTGTIMDDWASSGDAIGIYSGGVAEYNWGQNRKSLYPAKTAYKYMAVSYESGARKTFYSSAGLMSWNYYFMCVDNKQVPVEANKFYVDSWYTRLVSWFAAGKVQNITGTVTYSGALDNATIQAYAPGDRTKPLGCAWSNKTGFYTMKIAPGTYDMVCWKPSFKNATLSSVAVVQGTDKTGQNFALTKGVGNITGQVKVTDPRLGKMPVSGVRVKATGTAIKETRTDINGYYGLYDLPTGAYTVTADTLGYINATITYASTNSSSQSATVVLDTTITLNFVLKTGSISGRVYDASTGKALKNAYVYAVKNGTSLDAWNGIYDEPKYYVGYDFTAEDGTFYLDMLGAYQHDIRACADGHWAIAEYNASINEYGAYIPMPYGYSNVTQSNKAVTLGNETGQVNFAMNSNLGTLKGTVTNASSAAAISGAQVRIELTDPAYMKGFYDTIVTTYAGIDGSYSAQVPAGTYKVTASNVGYKTLEQTGKIISVGGTTTVDAALTPGGTKVLVIFEWNASKTKASAGAAWERNAMIVNATRLSGYDYATWNMSWNDGSVMYNDEYCDGPPTYSAMAAYDVVLYYATGNIYPEKTFPGAHADAIQQYLNGGGSFGIWAHEWIYNAGGSTSLMTNGFFLSTFTDDGATDALTAKGVTGDPISSNWASTAKTLLTTAAGGMNYEDKIVGDAILFNSSITATPTMAIRSNPLTRSWKSVWMAFNVPDFTTTKWVDDAGFRTLVKNQIDWLAVKPAYAPILSGAGMNKTTDGSGASFRYFINWTDKDNEAPKGLWLTIDGKYNYNISVLGGEVTPGDTVYRDGKAYYIDIANASVFTAGEHTYNFSGFDTKFSAVGATGVYNGPTITDTQAPTINYTQTVTSVLINTQVAINGTLTDNVKINNATLCWSFLSSKAARAPSTYNRTDMQSSGNQLNPGDFRGVIPGQLQGGTIWYYLEAGDGTFVNTTSTYQIPVTTGGVTYGVDLVIDSIGDGTYGTVSDGAGGTSTWTSAGGATTYYPIVLQNEGGTSDTFQVPSAPTSPGAGWTVTLKQTDNSTTIGAFPWTTPSVAASGTYNLYLQITAPAAPAGGSYSSIVGARSVGDIAKDDSVTATATIGGTVPTSPPTNVAATKSVNDISLGWTAVGDATEYNIYISIRVNGTGFNFASPSATVAAPTTTYTHTGAFADSNNYSYAVKSKNAAGENATASNIAFKQRQRLYTTGIAGGGDNLISLPYGVNITNAGGTNTSRALRQGILDAGGLGVTVARWNQSTGGWDTQTALGTKFVLKAGEGYKVYLTNEIWYPLVGSYKPTTINLYTTGIAGGGDNLICLPYNMNITNAGGTDTSRALRQSILDAGGLGVTVARWNQSTGGWDTQTALGTKFVLKAGEGYKIYLTNTITWACTVREPTA